MPLDPVCYTVTDETGGLCYRVEGVHGNRDSGGEYQILNGDFSRAGTAYRSGSTGIRSGFYLGGIQVHGTSIEYRVSLNSVDVIVRHNPGIFGGNYIGDGTSLKVDALWRCGFWLYNGNKEVAKMHKRWFRLIPSYSVSIYDEEISIDAIMGMCFGVLAALEEQRDRASSRV